MLECWLNFEQVIFALVLKSVGVNRWRHFDLFDVSQTYVVNT